MEQQKVVEVSQELAKQWRDDKLKDEPNSMFSGKIQELNDEIIILRTEVLGLLLQRDRNNATEKVVNYILSKNNIYTIRHDEKVEMWIYHDGIYISQGKTYIKEICRNILEEFVTSQFCNEVILKIEMDTYVESKDFFKEQDINIVCLKNGLFNIKTKELLEYTPKLIFFNKLNCKYYPDAKCPNIIKHLSTVLSNENDLLIMQELFGYFLLRNSKFEKAFMFNGNGRNGKGKTLEIMKHFLGIDNCTSLSLETIEKSGFEIAELQHKLANIAGDINDTSLKKTGKFKSLIGSDLISANRKFQTNVNFTNYAKMIFCCNQLPKVYDNTFAFWERWVYFDFPYNFIDKEEYDILEDKENYRVKDPDIIKELTTENEMNGLFNWAVEGLHRLLEQKGFSNSKTSDDIKRIWNMKSGSFQVFAEEFIVSDYDSYVPKEWLRKFYIEFCKKNKVKIEGDKVMKEVIENMGAWSDRKYVDGVQIHVWSGIKLSKVSQVRQGVSLHRKNTISMPDSKRVSSLTYLTKEPKMASVSEKKEEINNQPVVKTAGKVPLETEVKPKKTTFLQFKELLFFILNDKENKTIELHKIVETFMGNTEEELLEFIEKMKLEGLIWIPKPGYVRLI